MHRAAVYIVSGKGGVGKTCVAAALALAAARRGQRVLLCEMNGGDRIAELLGVAALGYKLREVIDGISLVDAQPQEALREYVLLVLRFEALYKTFFDNPLVRSFIQAVPSLGELVMIGKVWYHTAPRPQAPQTFDLIVVDAPASGHALAMLGAPATVAEAVPPGPMRDNALLLRDMLQNGQQTCVVPVCLAEDMPVTEVLQLAKGVQALGIAISQPIVNALVDPLPAEALAACLPLQEGPAAPAVQALLRRDARGQEALRQLARLRAAGAPPALSLPYLSAQPFNLSSIERLAAALADFDPAKQRLGPLPAASIGEACR